MTDMRKILAVIPSRFGSSRLPGKPLISLAGKTLIERVWHQGQLANEIDRVVVATDNSEIADAVAKFGGEVVMTDPEISTGSERVLIAARILGQRLIDSAEVVVDNSAYGEDAWDIIVNIQGDMPFISSEAIDSAIRLLAENSSRFAMTTIATPIFSEEQFQSPSVVKVVVGNNSEALYFSRAPIPYSRDGVRSECAESKSHVLGLKHMGLYVFAPETLRMFGKLNHSALERIEMLEQLRILENGHKIGVFVAPRKMTKFALELDTPEDIPRAQEVARKFQQF